MYLTFVIITSLSLNINIEFDLNKCFGNEINDSIVRQSYVCLFANDSTAKYI